MQCKASTLITFYSNILTYLEDGSFLEPSNKQRIPPLTVWGMVPLELGNSQYIILEHGDPSPSDGDMSES